RINVSDDSTFSDLLTQVREVSLAAYANQDIPFEKLVEKLRPERDPSHTPLFQVMLAFQDEIVPVRLSGLSLNILALDYKVAKCDLTLIIRRNEQGLIASFEYNTDLFDCTTITRWLGHFETLLEAVVANPDERL